MSRGLSVNVNVRETKYFSLYHVCVCVSVLMPQRQCVKAVREHQVPKIDTPHGKEKEGEKEGETEEEERGMAG